MKVPSPPGSGKGTDKAKGVLGNGESEERRRQNTGLIHQRLFCVGKAANQVKDPITARKHREYLCIRYKWERMCEYLRRSCGRREKNSDCGVKLVTGSQQRAY